jgi:hypothetical protein
VPQAQGGWRAEAALDNHGSKRQRGSGERHSWGLMKRLVAFPLDQSGSVLVRRSLWRCVKSYVGGPNLRAR